MSNTDQLLELLVSDPAFRARFELDPAATARAFGLDELADELARDGTRLQQLDRRESRSSLAGAFLAAAAEAIGIVELGGHLFGADDAQAATGPLWHADQFGVQGTGGPVTPEVETLLHDSNVQLDSAGIADLTAGRVDPRIVTVLVDLSHEHKLTISAMASDHLQHTTGGSVSNHFYGRAVDIATVDGRPVDPSNEVARQLAVELSQLDPSIRPSEIGSPWALPGAAYFTDAEHQNHLHVGYDDPIAPDWKPAAADVEAPASGAVSSSADAVSDDSSGDESSSDESSSDDSSGDDSSSDESSGDESSSDESSSDESSSDESSSDESSSDESDDGDGADGESGGDDDSDSDSDSDDDSDEPGEGSNGEDAHDDDGNDDDPSNPPNPSNPSNPSTPDDDDAPSNPSNPSNPSTPDSDDAPSNPSNPSTPDSDDSDSAPASDGAQSLGDVGDIGTDYPGDSASREQIAAWMATAAEQRDLPRELPVMAALVESGLTNLDHGDADSVGLFQMRTSIWDNGTYQGYADDPALQLKWFLDHAAAVREQRLQAGLPIDSQHYGDWIADVERPAEQYRGRYQLRLDEARELLALAGTPQPPSSNDVQVLPVVDDQGS